MEGHFAGFVSFDDVDGLAAVGCDVDGFLSLEAGGVLFFIDLEAEIGELFDDGFADAAVAFADGGGEGEGINAAENGRLAADFFLEAGDVHIVGELGVLIAVVHPFDNEATVVGTAETFKAAFFVEVALDAVAVELEVAHESDEGGWPDGAGAASHEDAVDWGETHRVFDGCAFKNSGDGGAGADVADDELVGQAVFAFDEASGGVDGNAVVADFVDAVFVADFARDGEIFRSVGFVAVEARVGNGDNRGSGKSFLDGFDFVEDDRGVEWGFFFDDFEFVDEVFVDMVVFGEVFADGDDASDEGSDVAELNALLF